MAARLGRLAMLYLGLLVLLALAAPWLAPQDPAAQALAERLLAPSAQHWMGTDDLGRDVLSRMLYGGRVSLGVGTLAVLLSAFIGLGLGALAGGLGGWVDALIMRSVDVLLCVPTLFLVLALIVFLGPGIFNVVLVIALTGWTDMARLVRAEILSLREREFVMAGRAAGLTPLALIRRHLLPNAMGPVYVSLTFGVSGAILMESGLSFLGLGVQPPTASWGSILSSGRDYISDGWWLILFPSLAICSAMLAVYLVGDSVREALDPRKR
jgi:peptide/nickel transport system permease protein